MNRWGTLVRNRNYKCESNGNTSVEKKNDYKKIIFAFKRKLEMVEGSVYLNMDQ